MSGQADKPIRRRRLLVFFALTAGMLLLAVLLLPRYCLRLLIEDKLQDAGYGEVAVTVERFDFSEVRLTRLEFAGEGHTISIGKIRLLGWFGLLYSDEPSLTILVWDLDAGIQLDALASAPAGERPEEDWEKLFFRASLMLDKLPIYSLYLSRSTVRIRDARTDLDDSMDAELSLARSPDGLLHGAMLLDAGYAEADIRFSQAKENSSDKPTYTFGLTAYTDAPLAVVRKMNVNPDFLEALKVSDFAYSMEGGFVLENEVKWRDVSARIAVNEVASSGLPGRVRNSSVYVMLNREPWLMNFSGTSALQSRYWEGEYEVESSGFISSQERRVKVEFTSDPGIYHFSNIPVGDSVIDAFSSKFKWSVKFLKEQNNPFVATGYFTVREGELTLRNPEVSLSGLSFVASLSYDFDGSGLSYPRHVFRAEHADYAGLALSALHLEVEGSDSLLPPRIHLRGELGGGTLSLVTTHEGAQEWLHQLEIAGVDASALRPVWEEVDERLQGVLDGRLRLRMKGEDMLLEHAELGMREGGHVNLRSNAMDGVMGQVSSQVTQSIRQSLSQQGLTPSSWQSDLDGKIRGLLGDIEVRVFRYEWLPENPERAFRIHLEGSTLGEPRIPLVLDVNVGGDIEGEFEALVGLVQLLTGDTSGVDKL